MSKFTKTILFGLLTIALLAIPTITAHAGEAQPTATPETTDVTVPKIPPGHFLYSVKLGWESLQEAVAVDATKKALLKQEHLRNRIDELKYEIYINNNKNTAKLLQKIQEKRLEIEEELDTIPKCFDGFRSRMGSACKTDRMLITETGHIVNIKKNIEVLNNLLNNPRMPESSKKGLMNAVNKSGMKLTANMAQGSYKVSSNIMSMLPFKTANLYEPSERIWYSVVINRDSVDVSAGKLIQPDVMLYPTRAQMKEFTSIASNINKNGLGWKEVGRITKLWYNIKKEENYGKENQ